jgi:DNA polymerase kappa
MDKQFGLVFLLRTYLGIASNIVRPHAREDRKSIGAERCVRTCLHINIYVFTSPHSYLRTFVPMSDRGRILEKLSEISVELEKDMSEMGWIGRTVTLKYKLDTYQRGPICFLIS